MKKEKSKVLKYAKKVDRLAKLRNILSEVPKYAFISGGCIGLLGCVMMSQVLAAIGISGILTAALVETFSLVITDTIVKSKWKTEEKVDKLVADDGEERQILEEYTAIKDLKNRTNDEIRAKKILIKEIISRKNKEAKEQNKLIKEMTKNKKSQAKQEVIAELDKEQNEEIENNLN